jgi:two-component system, cell cycle sensor histidine kinase and response regulator CckA
MSTRLSTDVIAVLESIADAALVVDAVGRIVFANARCARLFGYEPAALIERQVEDLLPPEYREAHASFRNRGGAPPEARRMGTGLLLVAQRKDGTTVPVDISLQPFGGDSSLVLACVRDMSEHTRLREAAEQAEDRYRMVVNSASEVFYRVRIDHDSLRGVLEFVSPQCEKLTGRRPDEFLGNPSLWIDCIDPEDRPALFQMTQEILAKGVEGSRHYRIRNLATGEYRWVADRVVPLHDDHGHVTGYQGAVRDITERRREDEERQRLEEELRQAQKMDAIGRLAGGVAHDFNNLVTVILASCDHAKSQVAADSPVEGTLEEIADAGQRATELTKQLLTLSHEQPSAPRILDLNAQLSGSQALIRRMLPDTIEVAWQLADTLWPVCLDEGQLDQIVFNVVANARDAMPHGGIFTVATRNVVYRDELVVTAGVLPPGDYVQLSLADTGTGMDAATIAHVFEPFYTTKPAGEGTGLGLASVYGIVKQNRGDVHIESTPGSGTRVIIHFPRCQGQTADV